MTLPLPSPAIVSADAARRLPRAALWALTLAYVLPGFWGRGPWKHEDLSTYAAIMQTATQMAAGNWGQLPWVGVDGPLTLWIGGLVMWAVPEAAGHWAVRSTFAALLLLTLACTWYACYNLARRPGAQPVAPAFGSGANPVDYARALADGALLALISCLGMAQLGHETTSALVQLCAISLAFVGVTLLRRRPMLGLSLAAAGLLALAAAGAPTLATLLGMGASALMTTESPDQPPRETDSQGLRPAWGLLLVSAALIACCTALGWWRWRLELPTSVDRSAGLAELCLWFTWPAAPMAIWSLVRWRRQLLSDPRHALHLSWPLYVVVLAVAATLTTSSADRSLLLSLPALATLASLALPTLSRGLIGLVDWFTLLFFSVCASVIWIIWLAMQTGWPTQPAANVARLAPGFQASFSVVSLALALAGTLAWGWLVHWRVGRHRPALWRSLVLPAGGATLCWMLLMSLWLPLLDYTRSYAPLVAQIKQAGAPVPGCMAVAGLKISQIAALKVHGPYTVQTATDNAFPCDWLLAATAAPSGQSWRQVSTVGHPADRSEKLRLYHRGSAN